MEESSKIASTARGILINSNHEGFAMIVSRLFTRQETNQYKSAKFLCDFFVTYFPNLLTLQLLKVYQRSSNGVLRFQSIFLLSEILAELRNRFTRFSLVTLYEIKPLLITCLTMQETKESDIKILRRILSFVAYNVVMLDEEGWDEFSDCIISLLDSETLKAFHLFVDLPLVCGKLIDGFILRFGDKAMSVLRDLDHGKAKDWSLGLETAAKVGVHFTDAGMRQQLIEAVVRQVNKLVEMGVREHMERGLEDLKKFMARNAYLNNYSETQILFVSKLAFEVAACYKTIESSNQVATEVLRVAKNPEKYKYGSGFDSDWYDYLTNLSAVEVLRIFASTDLEYRFRELAIRRLNVLLSNLEDIPQVKTTAHVAAMRELQPLLISCLKEEGLSDSMFKVLGEVVNHVTREMLTHEDETWFDLVDYIASKSKTEFERAVYIFQCITMPVDDYEFLVPVMKNLLPEISSRLNPPRELSLDGSGWVLAFTGAFCAIIHSIEIPSRAESVEEIAHKMVSSVRELVDRKMEVGLVTRAFRDMESIVKKQLTWYGTSEYKFLKGLLWRLYAIKGMKWESKIVLWRMNVIVEREVGEYDKELPEDELDWINQSEDEGVVDFEKIVLDT